MQNKRVRLAEKPIGEQSRLANGPFRAVSFEEQPIWAGLVDNLHDAIFPPHLPPLELTSTQVTPVSTSRRASKQPCPNGVRP